MKDNRQRFFVEKTPVRGDVVSLENTLVDVFSQRDYPLALKKLLGEMLVAASLLASTIKINGRLSIQIQSSHEQSPLTWAMAECNHIGELRALAKWNNQNTTFWQENTQADDILAALKHSNINQKQAHTVLFINIEPEQGQRYQGIVEMVENNLAACISHYQEQSAQIPTLLKLASSEHVAGGMMVQKLPTQTAQESYELDEDLWPRLTSLTQTLTAQELLLLPAKDILHRLYHEEDIRIPEAVQHKFGCTCSEEKCLNALKQIGLAGITEVFAEKDSIDMDCQFCGQPYPIDKKTAFGLFKLPN